MMECEMAAAREHEQDTARRIQSVDRAVELLKAVAANRTPQSVGELADSVGLNRSTAWRLLMTLEHHGLIDRDPITQRYVTGYEVLRLAASASAHELIASRARGTMDRLARETGESVSLVVLTPRGIVAIDQSDTRKIASVSVVGIHLPVHATASGKLRLALAGHDEREDLLSGRLEAFTDRTIASRRALLTELEEIRRRGYATERDEFEAGVSGVSAPVFDPKGNVTAFLSIWGLSSRLPDERLAELGPMVKRAADDVTAQLGANARASAMSSSA
jgi:DNA-binding IclR family transcriptional regulator